jgi:large subunit ribosomal protein L19
MAEDKDLETVEEKQDVVEAPEESASEVVEEAEASEVAADEVAPVAENKIPEFRAGDVLRLGVRIKEGEKERTQFFEGMVLGRKGAGVNQTFTIRKIGAGGIAVERIFPLFSPALVSFEVRRRGIVRRAKVYFLRDIVGSTANVIKERKVVRDRTEAKAAKAEKKAAKAAKKTEAASQTKSKADKSTRSAKRSAKKSV